MVVSTSPENPKTFQYPSLSLDGAGMKWVCGSGLKGVEEVKIEFGALRWERGKVRLYFAEFDASSAGERVFDVLLQGRVALAGLDVFREAGGARRTLVKTIEDVDLKERLVIRLRPAAKSKLRGTILCGIELIKR